MAGKVNVPITVAVQGIAKVQSQLNQLSNGIGKVGATAGIAAAGFAAFAAAIKVGDFAIQAIQGARDLERNLAGLEAVFASSTERMTDFSRNAVNMGLSLNQASKASIFIGSVLKQSGFSISETADLTERLVALGQDLSLTYGYDVQEALLGMTALFRGEYDPIEKFGVAMKQSEINAELAARGQDKLTGAQRRFAEQQIRVELLFQRSADAQGAFMRQSGTLAVEQMKTAAAFENLRDTVAQNMLPVMADLAEAMRGVIEAIGPELTRAFDILAPKMQRFVADVGPALTDFAIAFIDALQDLIRFIGFIQDNWSVFSSLALGVGAATISFNLLTAAIGFATAAHDTLLLSLAKNPYVLLTAGLIGAQVAFHNVTSNIQENEEHIESVTRAARQMANDLPPGYEGFRFLGGAAEQAGRYLEFLRGRILETAKSIKFVNTTTLDGILAASGGQIEDYMAKNPVVIDPPVDTGKSFKKITNHVADFVKNLQNEIQKQTARIKLQGMGAPEGLIDMILGSEGWMKIWLQIKQGTLSLKALEEQFYRTAAGAKKLADDAKAIEDYNKKIEEINKNLEEELTRIRKQAEEVKLSFADMFEGFAVLPTIEREMGRFEEQFVRQLESIESALRDAFRNEEIYEAGYNALKNFAQQELRLLTEIGRQRDELAQRFDLAKGLIDNYKRAFTAALDLTQLFGQLKEETETRTVTSVSKALMRLGGSMREFEVTISSSYEETIGGIQNRTQGILTGFREMAEKARAFGENLRKLRALGLHGELFQQLIDAGIDAGGATAQALVEGGSDTINELNNLYKEIEAVGADLGEDVASELYGTGIDMANGLLEGIRSKQAELENQARTMAQAFNAAFQAALSIQVDAVAADRAKAATDAAAAAIAEIPLPEGLEDELPIDQAALARIRDLIEGADRYIRNISDATKRAGAIVKRDIFRSLEADILAGRAINLSGISSGMTSGELAQAAIAAGGTTVNNYYTIEVAADTRASGSKAGEVIVEALQQFNLRNGAFNVQVAV